METRRPVARPMGDEAYATIDIFLGIPEYDEAGKITKYNRIDTFSREELLQLAERKLKLHLSRSKYNTLNTFIEDEVNQAKTKRGWFNPQTEKDQYFPLEHYINYLRNNFASDLSAKILKATNWIEVFDAIDIDIPIQTSAYVTTTLEQKKAFFSKASFNLTCQYLYDFKRKTLFLSDEQKIIFIEQMNVERPRSISILSNGDKNQELFDQTTFSAQNNYFDFLMDYQNYLKGKKTGHNLCVGSITYPPEIYDKIKALKPKFDSLTQYWEKFKFFVDNDLSPESTIYHTTADPTKQKLSKNQISIEPQTDEEKIEFNRLFFEFYHDRCRQGVVGSKIKYRRAIEAGADRKEHTKNLIEEIKNTYNKDKESPLPDSFKSYSIGYLASINGSISDFLKQPTKHNFFAAFCKGFCDERFRRFLEEELQNLELPKSNPSDTDKENNPIENLDKMIFAYQGFIDECEVDFPHAFKDNRNDRIYALYSKMFDLEMYDVAHRAFQEIKKLPSVLSSNADNTINYYLKKTNEFITRIDVQIEKFDLDSAGNFITFNCYHTTVGWLRKFNNELKSLLNIQSNDNEGTSEKSGEIKKQNKSSKKRVNEVTNAVTALFCSLINDSGLIFRGDSETLADFCTKVCQKYSLKDSPRLRIEYSGSGTNANIDKVKRLILPNIDNESSQKILEYLNKKPTTK